MKQILFALTAASTMFAMNTMAQEPVSAEEAGLTPLSITIYVNPLSTSNNGSTESLGVDITVNDIVVVGWEDDGDGLLDTEAVWTLYDLNGNSLTPDTTITSTQTSDTLTSKFLSYFRTEAALCQAIPLGDRRSKPTNSAMDLAWAQPLLV